MDKPKKTRGRIGKVMLADGFPELAAQVVDMDPATLATNSNHKPLWRCAEGHEWQASVANRTRNGSGCPYCAGLRKVPGVNDLAALHPEVAATFSADNDRPLAGISPNDNRKYLWDCPEGHPYTASAAARVRGSACPYCAGQKVLPGFNDLATVYPEIAAMWSGEGLSPTEVSPRSRKKIELRCPDGHIFDVEPMSFTRRPGARCPVCTGRRLVPGINDLATVRPETAALWDGTGVSPAEVTAGSSQKMNFRCSEGHRWSTYVHSVSREDGTGCPTCAGNIVDKGRSDLATLRPDLAAQWHPDNDLGPDQVSEGSGYMARWRCAAGHEWQSSVYNRAGNDSGCRGCRSDEFAAERAVKKAAHRRGVEKRAAQRRAEAAKRREARESEIAAEREARWYSKSLQAQYPDLAAELVDADPAVVTVGSGVPARWRCSEGHEWEAAPNSRTRGGKVRPCAMCSGAILVPGVNDLATLYPEVAEQWHPDNEFGPDEIMPQSNRPTRWRCGVGHEWSATANSRVGQGSGCRRCSAGKAASAGEDEVAEYIAAFLPGAAIERHVRGKISRELDIYLPDHGVAVEYNGVFWHSELRKGRTYHKEKVDRAREAGVDLIFVWEDDWRHRRPAVEHMLAARLGGGASLRSESSQVSVDAEVPADEASALLDATHVRGAARSSHRYGLRDGNETLIAVLCLRRFGTSLHLVRYAALADPEGCFDRLLAEVRHRHSGVLLVADSDNEVTDDALYRGVGFTRAGDLPPNYTYLVGGVRKSRHGYPKSRFQNDPDLVFKEGLTAVELASLNKIPRVWDAGKVRWTLRL